MASNATVRTLELKQCDTSLVRPNLDPPIALTLQLSLVETLTVEHWLEHWLVNDACFRMLIKKQWNATLGLII